METDRIRVYPASREQMESSILAEKDDELKKAYGEMLDGCLAHPDQWDWYAMWMIEKTDGTHIGDLCFKGLEEDNPEIGYGILEEFQGNGYATEAVKLALQWAFDHHGIVAVEAETDPDNVASQKVLKKCGFEPNGKIGEEGPRFTVYNNMEIMLVDKHNFTRDSLKDFQRYQEVKNVYRLHDGKMILVYNPFTEDWDATRRLQKAEDILSGKYVTYCAFEENCVVGEIMLIPQLNKGRLIIDSFHVSTDYRRRGIGRFLLEAAKQEALKRGAHALYASCCSSEETINFYSAMGFRLSSDPISSYVEDEPYDLQMECIIK